MTKLTKFVPYALILAAFLAGSFLGDSSSDKELEKKYEQEQQQILEVIGQKDAEIMRLNDRSRAIIDKMRIDSLQSAAALERNQTAYNRLKKKYNEINLNRASSTQLDSVLSRLYPR